MSVQMQLEVVPIPVSDIDRAKAFYVDELGFDEDADVTPEDGVRVVQLTPPGSACSIVLGEGLPAIEMEPGTLRGLHLIVADIDDACIALRERGVEVGEVEEQGAGVKYAPLSDPDGNAWTLQELPWRS